MANRLPEFQTLDELVEFWEEHDFGKYWDDLEEVTSAEAAPDFSHSVTIELPLETLMEAVERLNMEDARQLYERLSERLQAQ